MAVLDRRNAYSAIPQLEGKLSKLTNYITIENGKVKISAKDLYLKGSELTVSLEEVGLSYVDKDEIIAQINASEEGVLISADKVNIAGAAIFSEYAKKEEASEDVQRIYYRTNTTNTPAAPTSWITSTAEANNTWTTKRMPYDRIYKYLFSCIQQKMADGEIETTTVLLDDTTTVIDGGNIITGTVTLNQIAVASQGAILNSELADDIEEAGETATTYIRNIYGKGLCICRSETDNDNVLALTNGAINVYADGDSVASYGSTTRVGSSSYSNIRLGSSAMDFYVGGSMHGRIGYSSSSDKFYINQWGYSDLEIGSSQTLTLYGGSGTAQIDMSSANTTFTNGSITLNSTVTSNNVTTYNLGMGSALKLGVYSSSRDKKTDISYDIEDEFDPHKLYDLKVATFRWKEEYQDKGAWDADKKQIGFIAEDVHDAYYVGAIHDTAGKTIDWSHRTIIPAMLALIQEQNERIKVLERRNECLNESRR